MGNQERDPPGGEAEVVKHGEDHGKGKGLIGKKVIKEQAHGEIVDYDEETHDYKVKFSDDNAEELKWSELKDWLAPEISFKRFPQKKKELPPEDGEQDTGPHDNLPSSDDEDEEEEEEPATGEAENASETEASFHDAETEIKPENSEEENEEEDEGEEEEEPLTNSHRKKEKPLQKPTGTEVTRTTADAPKKSPERNGSQLKKQKTPEPEPEPESESEPEFEPGPELGPEEEHGDEEDEEGSSGDEEEEGEEGDSDSSINESDLEMITRKRKKKKRKHVLTLQRWRGYKKKRKLAAEAKKAALAAEDPEAAAALDLVVTDAMEEVAPRKKSRTRKLAEVDEIQRKRQKIAMELKKKLEARSKSKKRKGGGGVEEEEEEEVLKMTPLAAARHLDGDEIKVSPYSDSKPSPFDRGIKLRGRKLRKIFKGKVARGEIADYDRRTRLYKVRYEDGEVEKLMWKHVEPMLVPFEQLHTWDDPDSETLASVLAAEKQQAKVKEKAANKTPKLKPLTVKRR